MNTQWKNWYYRNLKFKPWITYLCIVLCVIVFLFTLPELSGYGYGLNIINRFGVARYYVAYMHQYYRLITAAFVHLSWWHIGMNMYVLWQLGTRIEDNLGHGRYAVLLLSSVLLGNTFVCLLSPRSLAAGMSTGLYGLMIYDIVHLARRYGLRTILQDPGIRYTIIVNLILNFIGGVSWAGHLGGAVAGLVFGMIM